MEMKQRRIEAEREEEEEFRRQVSLVHFIILRAWVSEWVSEWLSKWVIEWMIEWVSEWVSEWVWGCVFVFLSIPPNAYLVDIFRTNKCFYPDHQHIFRELKLAIFFAVTIG